MNRVPRVIKLAALMMAAVMAGLAGGRTTAEFSSTTANSANSFSAAASFGAGTAQAIVAKTAALSTSYTTETLADSPVAHWRFGEAAGASTAVDASGNGNNGTIPTTAPKPLLGQAGLVGDSNTAFNWPGGTYPGVTVPHAAALQLNGSFSLELWMNPYGHTTAGERWLFDKGGNPDVNGWRLSYDSTGTFRLRRNNVAVASTTSNFSSGLFRHIVVTHDGTTVRFYFDGLLNSSTATTFPTSSGTGALSIMGNWTFTDTLITVDEPAVYATALSANRVKARYAVGRMTYTDLCSAYRLYTNITNGGSPATGVSSVTTNIATVTSGATAVPMTAGSYPVGGVAYAYRSGPLRVGVQAGTYSYSVDWVDGSGSHTQTGLSAKVDNPIAIAPNQWLTGVEHGVLSSPELFSAYTGTTSTTTTAHSGSYALVVTKTAGVSAYVQGRTFGSSTTVSSFALRLPSLPTADVTSLVTMDLATDLSLGFQVSTGKLTLRWGTNSAVVAQSPVVAGAWFTVDLQVYNGAGLNTAAWRVDEVDQPSVNLVTGAQGVSDVRFGSAVSTDVFTLYVDDIVTSQTLSDYPIGPVRILASRPNGFFDMSGASYFTQENGTAVTSTSWQRLDDVPMNSAADGIRQSVSFAGAVLDVAMEDTTEMCVRGVAGIVSQHKTASQANNMTTSVRGTGYGDKVGDATYVTNAGQMFIGVTPFEPWTATSLNGLRFSFGNSTDINPLPYWDALMFEYVTSP